MWHRLAHAGLAAALVVSGIGCAGPRTAAPDVDYNTLDEMSFVHDYVAEQPLVTVEEAYRAITLLAEGRDVGQSFDERRAWLEERKIARRQWNLRAENVIDRGSVAYMVCRVLNIEGGVNRVIFGSWGLGDRRYAMRELVYRGLLAEAPDYRYMTGPEMVGLMRKAEDYMQEHGFDVGEKVDIGPAPEPGEPVAPQ